MPSCDEKSSGLSFLNRGVYNDNDNLSVRHSQRDATCDPGNFGTPCIDQSVSVQRAVLFMTAVNEDECCRCAVEEIELLIISASLSIRIAEQSAHPIRKSRLSICRSLHVSSGNTADWIWMPFGMVSGVGRMMGVLDGVVIVEGEGAVWG